ncbi:DinB family protein [Polaribacter sp. MSW13]|uniref:DinB family protein n=1 Tax=Polaribacter marinus TaxID=2916838 RepID=A0A9X1VKP4_9FLAO|nr:DinB family protein [Polaribacter marinus]MCI2227763.1 DinB family protein [Polaribacter marinus]
MIDAIEKNLERGIKLLKTISDEEYADKSVAPYFSSIGCHIRHVLDVFTCVFNGLESKSVDLSIRERNELAQTKTVNGILYFNKVISQLREINEVDFTATVQISDDLGLGKFTANYSLAAALMQAQSHALHHFATIGYIIYQLGIELPDADFGFNPTTPKMSVCKNS